MRTCRLFSALLLGAALAGTARPAAQAPARDDEAIAALLRRLELAIQSGRADDYAALLSDTADRRAALAFARAELSPGATRAVVRERGREPLRGTLPGEGYSLSLDVLVERGARGRSAMWRLDVRRWRGEAADEWRIVDQERLTLVEDLYRLSLDPARAYEVRDLTIAVEDLDVTIPHGAAYPVDTDQGITGFVFLGRGDMRFHPAPAVERGQLKIFSGSEALDSRIDAAFLRLNPHDLPGLVEMSRLTPQRPDPRELRRAEDLFREYVSKSYAVDLGDMSRDLWSTLPARGDFVLEMRTARYATLTYAHSGSEPEDISFFDRARRRNIAVYGSAAARRRFGRSYSEDDLASYDVLGYDLDVSFTPERQLITGRARLQIRILAAAVTSITLRLADALAVQSIASDRFGRLLGIRIRNQNSIVVNLPSALLRDDDLVLTVAYGGRLEPQREDSEALQGPPRQPAGQQVADEDLVVFQPERSYLYSNRSYWYPQAPIADYATASLRITVPADYDCVASGMLDEGFPMPAPAADGGPPRKVYLFTTAVPLRYLAFVVSRFVRLDPIPIRAGGGEPLTLLVEANPRQVRRARELAAQAADIIRFYESLLGDCPFPTFTLAVVESDLPGGHSPGYFALLHQPLPTTPYVWRNDPASFEDFPEFFLAHEIAHQWWGQAVGWRNYHEQWLSEGFAQYFAALYARHRRGEETFAAVLRQFRRWGMQQSDQGPISLGYRLGHIRGDSRIFRAVVYNKSAAVLHMLRRLLGDEAFFQGLRRFYRSSRFAKAGTETLRRAMEEESGQSLGRFFDQWIDGTALPRIRVDSRIESGDAGPHAIVHVEQLGETFEVPLTLAVTYADKRDVPMTLPLTEMRADWDIPLEGPARGIAVARDAGGALVDIVKN